MPGPETFIDTNVLIYLLSADPRKADQAEAIVRKGGRISVQVLNELTHVARRKLTIPWMEIYEFTSLIRSLCLVEPLSTDTYDKGCHVAERYGLSVYDAMIAAAALIGGCEILYSEDMQDGLLIDRQLAVRNPFKEIQ
jgi:predicted nucleic acid-binding protein